jgi:hypothetical protein
MLRAKEAVLADPFDDEPVDDLRAYLSTPPESVADTEPEPESRPEPEPDDAAQSSPDDPEVAPADTEEQVVEPETPAEESTPGEESPPEPPAAAVDWDSPENPHLAAAKQLEKIQQLYEQQQAETAATERKEKFVKGVSTLASEVDAADVPSLASDLYDEIAETAVEPYVAEINRLARDATAVVAALNELPAQQQEFVRQRAKQNLELGQTAADIEKAFTIRQSAQAERSERETKLAAENKALKAQLAAAALKQTGSETVDEGPAPASRGEEPQSILDYLQGTDDEGRSLRQSPYQRRTG